MGKRPEKCLAEKPGAEEPGNFCWTPGKCSGVAIYENKNSREGREIPPGRGPVFYAQKAQAEAPESAWPKSRALKNRVIFVGEPESDRALLSMRSKTNSVKQALLYRYFQQKGSDEREISAPPFSSQKPCKIFPAAV